jgi:hypothetical protein
VVANWSVTVVLLVVGVFLLADPAAVPGIPEGSGSRQMQPMDGMRRAALLTRTANQL